MKQISVSDNAHNLISKEIEEEREKKMAKKSFGTIVDDMCEKRYKKGDSGEQEFEPSTVV